MIFSNNTIRLLANRTEIVHEVLQARKKQKLGSIKTTKVNIESKKRKSR